MKVIHFRAHAMRFVPLAGGNDDAQISSLHLLAEHGWPIHRR
jgi:hypothetical protein